MGHREVKARVSTIQIPGAKPSDQQDTSRSAYSVMGRLVWVEHWRGTGLPTHCILAPHGVPVSGWLTDSSTHINHLIMPLNTTDWLHSDDVHSFQARNKQKNSTQ